MLCISLRVQAVEIVILVKPIGIFTHVLTNIFFGTKNPMFLNIQDSCDASIFKIIDFAKTFSQLKIKEGFHIERLNPELNK